MRQSIEINGLRLEQSVDHIVFGISIEEHGEAVTTLNHAEVRLLINVLRQMSKHEKTKEDPK